MNKKSIDRLLSLREKLFNHIKVLLDEDGHCKSYEGCFEIRMPNYFDERSHEDDYRKRDDAWCIKLHCYLVGPARHYEWHAESLEKAVQKCEEDVSLWIKESEVVAD